MSEPMVPAMALAFCAGFASVADSRAEALVRAAQGARWRALRFDASRAGGIHGWQAAGWPVVSKEVSS